MDSSVNAFVHDLRAQVRDARDAAVSAAAAAERGEMAHLELRREMAEMSFLVKKLAQQIEYFAGLAHKLQPPRGPTLQDLVDAYVAGTGGREAIQWPLRRCVFPS